MFCALQISFIILLAHQVKFGESLLRIPPLSILEPAATNVLSEITDDVKNLINNLAGVSGDVVKAISELYGFVTTLLQPIVNTLTSKCCGKYGCFTVDPPFWNIPCRPLAVLPFCQDVLNVKFYLWTRDNLEEKDVIDPENLATLESSHFRKSPVFIYINGYGGSGDMFFVKDMKNAYLKKHDSMFVSVEWSIGARMDYITSTANGQMVSAITAYFVQETMKRYNISARDYHICGLSLGAHVAGDVGKRIPGIGRITGLDPAKQLFEGCNATIRLSRTDALFVDIIHTDLGGFGIITPSGHVDIFVNGGYLQPACLNLPICGHILTLFYYIDTLEAECPYLSYQCDDQDNFERGMCSIGCGEDGSECVPMGDNADVWTLHIRQSPTLFFMSIGDQKHYCVYHYYVEINCTDEEARLWRYGRNKDALDINLIGADNETGFQPANKRSIRFTTLPTVKTLITSKNQIGEIVRVTLKWVPSGEIPPSENCQSGNITEPTDKCCKEEFDVTVRCLMCPFVVTSIYAKNLETDNSFSYLGNKALLSNQEVHFDK